MKKIRKERVVVAMSGGVDSSVATALLKKSGFDVVGVFMKLWPSFDEKRAQRAAKKLGIPFYVFNFEKEFKKKVVDYFLAEYRAGRTPNPCVVCNKEIKFGLLFKKALSLDADYIATGHYARIQETKYKLLKGKDKNKDQSYFLWKLNQKMLEKILFPVGDYTKTEVRKLAKKFKLPVLNIPESQEICFVQTTISNFFKKYLKTKLGKIVDKEGETIGKHLGLHFYTIGQRRGIELSGPAFARLWRASAGKPFYVLDKDLKKNVLIVTKNEKDLYKKELIAKNVNWVSGKEPKMPLKVKARIRYRHSEVSATIKKQKNGRIKVVFSRAQRAVTPGQSVVFYKGQELLGGGMII